MINPSQFTIEELKVFLLIFFRVLGIFMFAPIFGSDALPARLKILLALSFSLIFYPIVDKNVSINNNLGTFFLAASLEVTVGIFIGLVSSFIFTAVQLGGQIIDQELGMSLANVIDPVTNQQVSIMGQFKLFIAVIIYLAVDGHHFLIMGVLKSFTSVPILGFSVSRDFALYVSDTLVQDLLQIAFVIGAPVVVSLMAVTISMGFMARVFPQLNIFVVGFSVRILTGLFVLMISVSAFAVVIRKHLTDYNGTLLKVIDLMKG